MGIVRRRRRPKLDARARVRLQFDTAVRERNGIYTEVDDLLFVVAFGAKHRLVASLGFLVRMVELGLRDDKSIRAGVVAFLDSPPQACGLLTAG